MTTIRSSDQRWHLPAIEQCKKCGTFLIAIAIAGESVMPRHDCPTRQPRCDAAIKQDNPDGPENEKRPLQLLSGAKPTMTTSASAYGLRTVTFTPSIWQVLDALKPNLIADDENET